MKQAKLILATVAALASITAFAEDTSETATELEPMQIKASTLEQSYAVPNSFAGTKTDTPLLETPVAVQVVPQEVIRDRSQQTIVEAAKNVSGVQSASYQFYDQLLIRGFDSGYGTIFRNGLQLSGITDAVNVAFVDRVEVIKGPSSVLYGRIEPGGFVNVVTKKPQEASAYSLEQQVGRWGFLRTTGDATGKVTEDGSLLYRLIVDVNKGDSWVDNSHIDNKAIAATLAWRPNAKFDVNLQLEHYDNKFTWLDAGVPVIGDRPANLPRDFSILYPQSWNDYPYKVNRTLVGYEWNFAINDAWKLTNRLHYVYSKEDQQGVYADAFDGVDSFTAVRFTHNPDWIRKTISTNLDLSGEFATGNIMHKMLFGMDWFRFTDDTPGSTGDLSGTAPLNIYNPVYPKYSASLQALASTDSTNTVWRDRTKDLGVYFQDQVEITNRWNVLLGGRYDWAQDGYPEVYGDRSSSCYPNCTARPIVYNPTDKAFSPRAGVLYKLSNAASVYGSYSKSFGTSNGVDIYGKKVDPQIGEQYELGFKAMLFDGRVTTSATLFDLTKSNIPEYDPLYYLPHIVGEVRSRGLELDVAGQITPNVSLIGSYTYDHAEITKDNVSGTQGNQFSGVAPKVANLWAKYDTAPGAPDGWAFGAGVYLVAQREGDDANTWQLPGYGRVDAMLAYRTKVRQGSISAQFNVNNLLDKTYFDHGSYGTAAFGTPRNVIGSVRLDF